MKTRSFKELAYILEYARTRFTAYDGDLKRYGIEGQLNIIYGVEKLQRVAEFIKMYGVDELIQDCKTPGAKRAVIRRIKKHGLLK